MSELIKIKTTEFDVNQYKEIIEEIEKYAVASILCGKDIVCEITKPYASSTFIVNYIDKKHTTFLLSMPINKKNDFLIKINFKDSNFKTSGFKGVFVNEKINYKLKRYGDHFEYMFSFKSEEYIEKTKRLMKLFRRYL